MEKQLTRFLMLGTDTTTPGKFPDGRAEAFVSQAAIQMGGNLHEAYALLGPCDVALIIDLPSHAHAVQLAVTIGKRLGLSFSTMSTIPLGRFDQMMEDLQTEIESARMEARE